MYIECGKRRLCGQRFGWKIEILHTSKKGEQSWQEDRPAYPASLSQALEMVLEREVKDQGDMTVHELPDALKRASHAVHEYMERARKAA